MALAAVPSEVEVVAAAAGSTEEAAVSAVASEMTGSSAVALVAQVEAVLPLVGVVVVEAGEEDSVPVAAAAGVD